MPHTTELMNKIDSRLQRRWNFTWYIFVTLSRTYECATICYSTNVEAYIFGLQILAYLDQRVLIDRVPFKLSLSD